MPAGTPASFASTDTANGKLQKRSLRSARARSAVLPYAASARDVGTTTAKADAMATAIGSPSTALVLSGGGARGAYAVGVLEGLHAILGGLRSRFDLFTGT